MVLPAIQRIDSLNEKHADAHLYGKAWQTLDILAQGGAAAEAHADELLVRRDREPSGMFAKRKELFTYQDIIGAGLGYYQVAVFKNKPQVSAGYENETDGEAPTPLNTDTGAALDAFQDNCDRARTKMVAAMQTSLRHLLLFGRNWVLFDLPNMKPANLAEERKMKANVPFIRFIRPQQVYDWQLNADDGAPDWVRVYGEIVKADPSGGGRSTARRWTIYTREEVAVYEASEDKDQNAVQVDLKTNPFLRSGMCALQPYWMPPELWIGNRAYLSAKAHLNRENALDWQLHCSNFAMPVISGVRDGFKADISEAGMLTLPVDAKFAWSEPEGKALQASQDRVDKLREEIYRQMHLQAQGKSSTATASASSGYSKEQDMIPANDVLQGVGDVLRDQYETIVGIVLRHVEMDQNADICVAIKGMKFDKRPAIAIVDRLAAAKESGIPSDTMIQNLEIEAGLELVGDPDEETSSAIIAEIKKAPLMSTRVAQQRADTMNQLQATFDETILTRNGDEKGQESITA